MLGPMVPQLLTAALLSLAPSPSAAAAQDRAVDAGPAAAAPRWHGYERVDLEVAGKRARLIVPEQQRFHCEFYAPAKLRQRQQKRST